MLKLSFMIVLVRIVLVSSVLLTGLITTARALPYPTPISPTVLVPQNCAPPCMLGIRPGATRTGEALYLLQAHPWINASTVRAPDNPIDWNTLEWEWNGTQPALLLDTPAQLELIGGFVVRMNVKTAIGLGDILLTLGFPDRTRLTIHEVRRDRGMPGVVTGAFFTWEYHELGIEAWGAVRCPITAEAWWNTPITLYTSTLLAAYGSTDDPLNLPVRLC